MLNKEVLDRDPTTYTLPNDGVAKVAEITDEKAWAVARYEVEQFVCEGSYHEGLRRILESYLTNLGQPTQRAVWVHGFYGSGKSHLVRVLEFLWRDLQFPDGATARGLAHLPDDITTPLRELTTVGTQRGGLWSAAGTLGATSSRDPRAAMLAVVLRGAGLPERQNLAQFDLWLREEDWRDAVCTGLEQQGRSYPHELQNLFVSTPLAEQLLAVNPRFADSPADALRQIREQFRSVNEVSTDLMVEVMRRVLASVSTAPDRLPCVLLVLDELQQYLADDQERTAIVQEAVEACVSRFESNLLFVATGQSALQATAILQKLQGRFSIPVPLKDTDVEKVLRQTVLRKKPSAEPNVADVLDRARGEIARHLGGSQIASASADSSVLVADYPLLPTRRRFWERVLREVDTGGTTAQLRTQLRLAYEAARAVANDPVGHVVSGDFIFGQQQASLLQTAVLLREVDEHIAREDDGTPDGKLRSCICALLFLLGRLNASVGVRANADTLCDLLVTDLTNSSASLRQKVPELLTQLHDAGTIALVEDEYRIQTREGAEWDSDYRRRQARLRNDDMAISTVRGERLRELMRTTLHGVALTQGESKTPRQYDLVFSSSAPEVQVKVPVWIRAGWEVRETDVKKDAVAAGQEDAVVYVFIPRADPDDVRPQIAGFLAAEQVLERPVPTTDEGRAARAAMQDRQSKHDAAINELIAGLIEEAKIYQGGGTEVSGLDFRSMVERACQASLARLFHRFRDADSSRWERVAARVKQGAADALREVGHDGEAGQHPVCREILRSIGESGKTGTAVRQEFEAPPYGWPRDAVTGALMVLTAQGYLGARYRGAIVAAPELDATKVQQTEFRVERRVLIAGERIALRQLFQQAGVACPAGSEAAKAPEFLSAMGQLAQGAGGDPPLPARPSTVHLEELRALTGNEQLAAILDQREALSHQITEWQALGEKAREREPRWRRLERLLSHAVTLPVHAEVQPEVQAVITQRSLLADPDPVPPMMSTAVDALRAALGDTHSRYVSTFREKLAALQANETWQRLEPAKQEEILRRHGLTEPAPPQAGSEEQLLAALDSVSLVRWAERTMALTQLFQSALEEAVRELMPKAVRVPLPSATVQSAKELETYLEEAKAKVLPVLEGGNPVILP